MENGQNFNWEDRISGFELVAQNADFMVHDAYTPEDQKEQYAYQRDAANITAGALTDLQNNGIGTYTANGTTVEISRDSETGSFTVTRQGAGGTSAGSAEVFSPDQADAAFDRFYNDIYNIVSGREEGVDGGIESRISGFETMAHSADFMEHDRYTPDDQRAGYEYQRETCSVMIDALHDVQATGHGEFAQNGVSVEIDRNRETGEWRVTETAKDGTITGNAFHPENGNEAIDSFYGKVYDVISNDGEKTDTGTEVPDYDNADNGIESMEGHTENVNADIDDYKRPPASGGAADSVPADDFTDTQENQDLQTGNDISAEKDIDTDTAALEDRVNTEANLTDENEESVNDDRVHEDTDDRQTEFIRTEDSDNSFTVGPDHDTTEEDLTEEGSVADTERVKDESPDKAAFHDVELVRDEDGNTTVSIDGYEMFTDPDPYAVNADDLSAFLEDNSDAIRVEISRGDSFASYDDFKNATENRSEWLEYLNDHADAADYIDSHIDEYDKPPEEWTQQDLMRAINDVESSGVLDDVDNEQADRVASETMDEPRPDLSDAGIDTDGLNDDQVDVLETGLEHGLSFDQLHEIAESGFDAEKMMDMEAGMEEDSGIKSEQSQIEINDSAEKQESKDGPDKADQITPEGIIYQNAATLESGRTAMLTIRKDLDENGYDVTVHPVLENGSVLYGIDMDSVHCESLEEADEKFSDMRNEWNGSDVHENDYDRAMENSGYGEHDPSANDHDAQEQEKSAGKETSEDMPGSLLSAAGIDTDGLNEDQINVLETGLQQGLSFDQLHEIAVSGLDADGMMELESDIWEDNSINYEQSQIENDLYDTPDDVSSEDRQWVHDHLVDTVMNSIDPEAFQYGGLTDRELRMLDDVGIELPDTYDYDMPVGGYDDEEDDETISIYDYKQEFAERIDEAMQELKESWDNDPDAFLSHGTMSISQDTYNLIEDIYLKGYELQDEGRETINSDIKDSLESIESALVDYEMAEGHDFNIIDDKPDASEEEKAAAMEDLEETRNDTIQTIQDAFDSYFKTGNDVDNGTENAEKDSGTPNTAETDSEDDVYIIDDYGFPIEDDDLSQKDVDEKTDQINDRIEGLMRDLSGEYRVHPDDFAERAQAIIEGNDIEDEIEDLEGEAYYDGYDIEEISSGIHDDAYVRIVKAVENLSEADSDEEKEKIYGEIQEAFDSYFNESDENNDEATDDSSKEPEVENSRDNVEYKGTQDNKNEGKISESDLIGRLQGLAKDISGTVSSVIQDMMSAFIDDLNPEDGQDKASNDNEDSQNDVEKENKGGNDTSWDDRSEWND